MSTRTVHFAPPPDYLEREIEATRGLDYVKSDASVDHDQPAPPLTRADWNAAAPAVDHSQSPTLVVYGRILNDEHHVRKELAHLLQAQHDYHGTLATIISHLEMMLRDARDLAKRFQAGGL